MHYTSRQEFLKSNHPILNCNKEIISIAFDQAAMRIRLFNVDYVCIAYNNNRGTYILDSSSPIKEQCDFDNYKIEHLKTGELICKWGFE